MACIQERLVIKSGLWWRAYGTYNYSHLSIKRRGWNKRVLRAEFFCYYMKKRLLLHRNKRAGRAKAQKSISEAARLLDRWEYTVVGTYGFKFLTSTSLDFWHPWYTCCVSIVKRTYYNDKWPQCPRGSDLVFTHLANVVVINFEPPKTIVFSLNFAFELN
jgi:hypothetical protein